MKILTIRTIPGPNIYARRPVLVMKIDLEELASSSSADIPGFTDRLVALLPGLSSHTCSKGYPGGFIERLHRGTYLGHIIEHVALELSGPAGIESVFGKTRYAGSAGVYNVVVEYRSEAGMRFLLETAVALVQSVIDGEEFPLEEKLDEARTIVSRMELGPSTTAMVEAAERRGIPVRRIGDASLVQLGHGRNRKLIRAAIGHSTTSIATDLASDKEMTKMILGEASIPVPRGRIVRSAEEAIAAFERLGAPVVVKPVNGRQGKGVSLSLTTPEQVTEAFDIARDYSRAVIVEEQFVGKDYRVLVVDGHVVAASERIPARVVGDGEHTIEELVEIENRNPLRGEGHEKPLTRLEIDAVSLHSLEKMGMTPATIPTAGEIVMLREGANLSTGGCAHDVTDLIHPEIASICARSARAIGLDICGVDLIHPDISQPLPRGAGIIELNASPGLRMHCHPSQGKPRDVGGAIIDMLYPPGRSARIPIISITGTNGKTTITRMIAHAIGCCGRTVGMTTTGGIFIGGERVASGDTTGPRSGQTILSDPSVEVAVLETARGGMMRSGLCYDWSDVGVISNIQPDHIGQDGIESIDDLVDVKALVAEQVRDGGTLVINADDENSLRLVALPRVGADRKRVIYFSLSSGNPVIVEHCAKGGTAVVAHEGLIALIESDQWTAVVPIADVPLTLGGAARFQVANVLAVVAACTAYGLSSDAIAHSITGFSDNPGRCNLFRIREGYAMIDYGHNPEALREMTVMASQLPVGRVTGVLSLPGDRADHIIEEGARIAARGFDRIIIKEDRDTRGRVQGEVAALIHRTVQSEIPGHDCTIIPDESEAIQRAVESIEPRELVIIFYEKLEPLHELLARLGAVAVDRIEDPSKRRSEEPKITGNHDWAATPAPPFVLERGSGGMPGW